MKRKDDCSEVKGSEAGPSDLNPLHNRRQNENPQRQETRKMFQEFKIDHPFNDRSTGLAVGMECRFAFQINI